MEKPSTKKPMNILKTMVFLNNFMNKFKQKHQISICIEEETYQNLKELSDDYETPIEWFINYQIEYCLKNLYDRNFKTPFTDKN